MSSISFPVRVPLEAQWTLADLAPGLCKLLRKASESEISREWGKGNGDLEELPRKVKVMIKGVGGTVWFMVYE